ncbi:MAG TPA: hypothetical protein VM140_02365 [Burkholderiales bacterium]|nr:hypothetical protein [Burkholderiales bacterium]
MLRRMWCAAALAAAMLPAHAQSDADLREEVRGLRQRVDELEKSRRAGSNAFNPDLSLILQGTAARSSQDPANFQITGFAPAGNNAGGEVGPQRRGFSLGESELVVASNIDPYFRGQLAAALTPENEIEVEEAFFQTLQLGSGLTLKGGRFLSAIGYQNPIHQHAWDFQDAALPYKAFLGGRWNDDGVQMKWVAPTDLFVELGTELGRGRAFPASDPNKNGVGAWTLFGHLGGDVGTSTAWRAGISYLKTSPQERAFEDGGITQSFSGRSRLWVADFVVKWPSIKLQGEYFRRSESGELTFNSATGDYSSRQSGWYLQSVYQLMAQWRFGYRHDRLDHGSVANGLGLTAADAPLLLTDHNPTRNTVMLDWSPSEFSRIRLQLAADKSRAGVTDNQVLLQYIYSLGAHGAHTF